MLVSVIIPAYNSAKTIERTLESVFNQDYPSIEIIVVNDGSTDNTELVLKKYENKIKYFYQDNAGVSVARNLGLEKSSGDYIQYLDADDLLAKGKLTKQIQALTDAHADVAYGDWIKFTEADIVYKELEIVEREMSLRPEIELITDFWIPLAALLYSRKVTKLIGNWNTTLPVIQDARYALDAALHNAKFIYTPGIMGYYRVHEAGSLSTRNRFNFMNDCFENAKQIDAIWRNDYPLDTEKKNAIINVLRFCVNEFSVLDKNKHEEAVNLILDIDNKYIPENSKGLRAISKLFGYRTAEKIAYYKRKLS